MSDEMNDKYQQHYNQLIVGTLTDTYLKSISYQANIRLANEIIKDQEKKLIELQESLDNLKTEANSEKTKIIDEESKRINLLQSTVKDKDGVIRGHLDTINRLNTEISELNRIKEEYDSIKGQVQHIDTFRKQLVQAREENDILKSKIDELTLVNLETTPVKKKKSEEVKTVEEYLEDGGSF